MGNRKLYIIGNGFDLWHGLPSRYADFKAYVRQHDRELLRTVDDYFEPLMTICPQGTTGAILSPRWPILTSTASSTIWASSCRLTAPMIGATRAITIFSTKSIVWCSACQRGSGSSFQHGCTNSRSPPPRRHSGACLPWTPHHAS